MLVFVFHNIREPGVQAAWSSICRRCVPKMIKSKNTTEHKRNRNEQSVENEKDEELLTKTNAEGTTVNTLLSVDENYN